jgi:hypothetical protein
MTANATSGGTASGSHAKLQAGIALGDYVLGQPLWPLRIADAYRANGPSGAATIYVIHANLARTPEIRDQIIAGTRAAAALPEHKHLVRTLAAGLTGEVLWIATEEVDGSLVRDMLIKKRQAGTAGFGVRGTGNLITGVSAALGEAVHGALATESVIVNRTGRIKVIDLALGPGTLAAMRAGLIPVQSCIAPEAQQPSRAGDVYSVGALLYEALVGSPLERGGPRPSEVVQGTTSQIDEIVARACHRDPDKRFGRAEVLGEVVAEALGQGGAVPTGLIRKVEPTAGASLNMELGAASSAGIAVSGHSVVDRALAAALADTTEKFLISKGRLDYGPFSLADVVKQIEKSEIVAGNIIMDKDTGARGDVSEHPLLGPIVETTRAKMEDARRAQAEAKVQSAQTKKGAVLYGFIALGVLGAAVAVWFIIQQVRGDDGDKKVAGVSSLEGAKLDIKISMPKTPPAKKRPRGGGGGGGSIKDNYSENMTLDLSDDSDETETLGMDKVFAVYSSYGRQLGGCLGSNGGGAANIGIIIDGPSGKVRWVKVNGQQSGGLYNCINRVMRSMQFPKINGPRTRAEFDIGV